ncbi:sugar-binding transcriptional regulator [Virgibacillus sp. AGTR]|uniref:Sugar-binding transcriptional regulator n=1 Tax=Virgibacillus salarius TaxID=447199 RepID=A0A941ICD1_9BACI|nr:MULTISPECIES: sugar-binding transcriptional regulator [Bacillaceae]NAZ10081.1 sugar-binding transcriptional regulator [Agaribacter marinus]MBR7797371.1 sugar-binding transcriptional regulator [Virgibacillus salarius]MCC2250690.1 sugar-binding transcriptional regulator [Virgibacillus sp. AGTR]QRZ17182.1 sugar-binding transcriptional regulator [Virgibacillus sp. AGTR]WBX79418.1 sugar-binding transcriptional regulator [Virgibacillus salarius]
MVNWEERRQLVKIANLYYEDNWTQEQIAKKLTVSRPIISKSLQKAKDLGIVEFYINDETVQTVSLEKRLESEYNLKDALVIPSVDKKPELTLHSVGRSAAYYLSKNMKDIQSLGISWGQTLTSLVKEYPYELRENMKVVPLEGGMGRKKVEIHANQLAYELAKKMGGECSFLYAPAIVESEELMNRLRSMEDISEVIEEGRNVDMAVISIGNPYEHSTLKSVGYLEEEDVKELKKLGVVGDMGFRFFDQDGKPVHLPRDKRVVGLSLDDLKQIKQVVAVVAGNYKADSLLGMLKGNYIDVLITDDETAKTIIQKSG